MEQNNIKNEAPLVTDKQQQQLGINPTTALENEIISNNHNNITSSHPNIVPDDDKESQLHPHHFIPS